MKNGKKLIKIFFHNNMNSILKESKKLKKTLKIFDIFLIFFVLSVVFLFFIFSFSKKDIKSSYYNIHSTDVVKSKKLNIRIDKKKYSKGEKVKIYLDNFSNKNLKEDDNSFLSVASFRYLGENYGVGLIEKKINNSWIAVEPVWRCENKCYERCNYQDVINSQEQKTFIWNQDLVFCDALNKTEKKEKSSMGTYRVSLAFWDDKTKDYSVLHSDEFIIN